MPHQRLLDLGRVHVEPAADVHVLEPVGDSEVTAVVQPADVAGMQPAVRVDRLSRGGRVVEVPEHHVRPAEQDLPGRASTARAARAALVAQVGLLAARSRDLDLEVRGGPARGRGHGLRIVAWTAHGHDDGLGQPVCGEHGVEAQLGAHSLYQRYGHNRRSGDRQPEAGQVPAAPLLMIQDRGVDRWRSGKHGDPHRLDQAHRLAGVEHELRDDAGAGQQAREDPRLVAEAVKERVDDQVPIVAGQLRAVGPGSGDVE